MAPPLDLSSTYAFDDTETFSAACERKVGAGYVYTRWANPTIDAFEAAVADLEGAPHARAFASGMAAISALALSLCGPGDRVVSTRQLYGNTYGLLSGRLARYGVETTFEDVDDLPALERALERGAAMLYCETIGNPRMQVADLAALGKLAHAAGVPLVVDNTFASPALCRPFEYGASAVVHSATKFLGGHHDLLGGVVCASDELVDGVHAAGRDLGGTLAPFNAWLALRGIATLSLRVQRSSDTALAVAAALERHPAVAAVHYPALDSSPDAALARDLLGGRGGGTLAFEVAGGLPAARRTQDALRLVRAAASLGGTHTLVVHAASTTHTQLGPRELEAAGISEGLCRLSVGLEDPGDVVEDLTRALDAA